MVFSCVKNDVTYQDRFVDLKVRRSLDVGHDFQFLVFVRQDGPQARLHLLGHFRADKWPIF